MKKKNNGDKIPRKIRRQTEQKLDHDLHSREIMQTMIKMRIQNG